MFVKELYSPLLNDYVEVIFSCLAEYEKGVVVLRRKAITPESTTIFVDSEGKLVVLDVTFRFGGGLCHGEECSDGFLQEPGKVSGYVTYECCSCNYRLLDRRINFIALCSNAFDIYFYLKPKAHPHIFIS